jgi:chloramphenicol O-acetyltransferase type A
VLGLLKPWKASGHGAGKNSPGKNGSGTPAPPSSSWPVDLERYPRRRLFECFRDHQVPVFSISTTIDISGYSEAIEARGFRFYTTLCCLISLAINTSSGFRHRIVDGVLMEYQRVHPSINVALDDGSFSFADAFHCGVFHDDYASIRAAFERARQQPNQDFRGGLDDRFFLTHLPWFSFNAIQHPYTPDYSSIPMISTGRTFMQEGRERLPIAVQAHHALIDGIHMARMLDRLSQLCRHPEEYWA